MLFLGCVKVLICVGFYGRKASPEIWALNNFKEFEAWYDANKKELEANAQKKGPKGKTAAKMAA